MTKNIMQANNGREIPQTDKKASKQQQHYSLHYI